MAESVLEEIFSNNLTSPRNSENLDCAVCLQTCIHPAELPCGHIFCYLCIKGIVNQGRRCAMCRQDIPADYLDKPTLLKPMDAEVSSQGFEDGHLWFYEGHNGWWLYDDRSSLELESAYQKGERSCELLIAGFLYVIDFNGMLQYRRNDPSRRRRIKRDIATTTKKGIAGIKVAKKCNLMLSNAHENVSNQINQNSSASNTPALNSLGTLGNINSGSNNFAQHAEPIQGHQRIREGNSSGFSSCRTPPAMNSNQTLGESNSRTNYNLDTTIQDTLDWAIEQIESLNVELLNDYETILWDYGQLEGNLSQSRCNRTPNNYTRYLRVNNPLNETLEIDVESTPAMLGSNDGRNNNTSPQSSPTSSRTIPTSHEINEAEVGSSQSVPVSPPQPPPRSRGLPGSRSSRDFQQRLPSDSFFQRFVSKR